MTYDEFTEATKGYEVTEVLPGSFGAWGERYGIVYDPDDNTADIWYADPASPIPDADFRNLTLEEALTELAKLESN